MIKDGYLEIDGDNKSKVLKLTDKGSLFCDTKILPIVKAENEAYSKFSKEELDIFFRIFETKYDDILESVEKL